MTLKITNSPLIKKQLAQKNIARLLAAGLFLNNIYFNANASDIEIPNRYETLEGEFVTIDDSTAGELHEIEIFGNTVQDENDLNDIQSVGDLYVDENGNPILDKQGREQYKIDIISSNINNLLLDSNSEFINNLGGDDHTIGISVLKKSNTSFTVSSSTRGYYAGANLRVKCEIGKTYQVKAKSKITYGNSLIIIRDTNIHDGWRTEKDVEQLHSFKFVANSEYVDIIFYVLQSAISENNGVGVVDYYDVNIYEYEGEDLSFEDLKVNSKSILLPTQLQKVGDIADRLYWDNEKRRYVIEKNISNYTIDGSTKVRRYTRYENHSKYQIGVPNLGDYHGKFHPSLINGIIKGYPQQSSFNNSDSVGAGYYYEPSLGFGSAIFIKIPNIILDTDNESEIKNYLNTNNLEALYKSASSQLVETNITSKLKIPTYEHATYVYAETENNINPTLKITVDRLPQIAKNAVEEAEIDPSVENISLARMYTNMLPESIYKDQLQERLNQVISPDITLDRKTVTANVDVYVKSENTLSMSLNTNSVTFEDYSGINDMELNDAVQITINSSLPYQLNAYMPTEISNSDGSEKISMDSFNIKESTETSYRIFTNTTDKVVLKNDCAAGNNLVHNIDLKLGSNQAHTADIYKTVIRFEAEQK